MTKKVIGSVQEEKDANLYEFAFHLVPKMSEEEALKAFTDIKNEFTASGAAIKNESAPALLNLAYQMEITVDSVKQKYTQAYFAWLIIEATGEQILAAKDELKLRSDVLRSLLITTKNESPIASADVAKALQSDEDEVVTTEEAVEEAPAQEVSEEVEEAEADKASEDDQKVDEAIDKLV
jgi:ribosomal protein S6